MQPQEQVLTFLGTRRSVPPAVLKAPGPDASALRAILEMAARSPDHGKLEPWRFIVIRGDARARIAEKVEAAALRLGHPPEKAAKQGKSFAVPVIVAVVISPVASPKIPLWEQQLSAGAVCLSAVNACLASGFGASWLTGVAAEPEVAQELFDLAEGETIAGLIHIGSFDGPPPPDRPRPDLEAKVSVLE